MLNVKDIKSNIERASVNFKINDRRQDFLF